jgi:hypothetical protein
VDLAEHMVERKKAETEIFLGGSLIIGNAVTGEIDT